MLVNNTPKWFNTINVLKLLLIAQKDQKLTFLLLLRDLFTEHTNVNLLGLNQKKRGEIENLWDIRYILNHFKGGSRIQRGIDQETCCEIRLRSYHDEYKNGSY
jgi:hypothetical protein